MGRLRCAAPDVQLNETVCCACLCMRDACLLGCNLMQNGMPVSLVIGNLLPRGRTAPWVIYLCPFT